MNKYTKKLFAYLKEQNMTQRDAAAAIGVSANTLSNWKKGGNIDPQYIEAIENMTGKWEEQRVQEIDTTFKIVRDRWNMLSDEDRLTIASLIFDLTSGGNRRVFIPKNDLPKNLPEKITEESKPIIVCPRCKIVFPCDGETKETFSCPHCGQHIRFR